MVHLSRATWQGILLAAAAGVFLWLLWTVRSILLPFLVALFLVYLTEPLIVRMERRGVPRLVAILVIYAVLLGLVWVAVVYLWPTAAFETDRLLSTLPERAAEARALARRILAMGRNRKLPAVVGSTITSLVAEGERFVGELGTRALTVTISLFSNLFLLLLAPVISFYVSKDLPGLRRGLLRLVPPSGRGEVRQLLSEINDVLGNYVRGQIVISSLVGLTTWIGLNLLGIPYSLLFGILAGLFDVIPYFGPVISAVPAVALAFSQSAWIAGYTALFFVAVHQLEGAILVPRIMGGKVGLHPVAVIFALLAGGKLFGFAGMILGVPVAAVLRVILLFGLSRLSPENSGGTGEGSRRPGPGEAEKAPPEPLPETGSR